jgi:hypothetical protein
MIVKGMVKPRLGIGRIEDRPFVKVLATHAPLGSPELPAARQSGPPVRQPDYPPLSAPVHEHLCRIFAVHSRLKRDGISYPIVKYGVLYRIRTGVAAVRGWGKIGIRARSARIQRWLRAPATNLVLPGSTGGPNHFAAPLVAGYGIWVIPSA